MTMSGPDTAAFIVLMLVILGIFKAFFKYLGSRNVAPPGPDTGTLDQLRKLEDRVRALETVISDQGYDLKEKFRELEKH
jgi:hypothetical protein